MALTQTPTRHDALPSAILLVLAWLIIAVPIIRLDPSSINQDTYQYLAIANRCLETPGWHIRDAHTVGPIIPAMLVVAKWTVTRIVAWSPDVDLAILKGAVLACYMVITLAAVKYHERKGLAAHRTAFVAGILLVTLPYHPDTLCLNGELVCVTWLALLFLVAAKPDPRPVDDALVVLLALLVIYTKLQAVLLLAAAFATCFDGARRIRLIAVFSACFIATDLFLLYHGAGWLAGMLQLGGYVRNGHAGPAYPIGTLRWLYTSIAIPLSHLGWACSSLLRLFPLAGAAVLAALALPETKQIRQSLVLWIVVSLASILIPGRLFTHYLLCFIPVIFLFCDRAFIRLGLRAPGAKISVAMLLCFAATKFSIFMPDAGYFGGNRSFFIMPRQEITPELADLAQHHLISPTDTVFVHGWDYRYYSYFNKGLIGPELGLVQFGSQSPADYLRDLLQTKPTFILDVVNYSGIARDPLFALAANPIWSQPISEAYAPVFAQNGLVVYRRRVPPPVAKKTPPQV